MWPFRPSPTPPDYSDRHRSTLDCIEQVATLRGQVRSMETEWDDIRAQIKKGFQRMEKANQRAEARGEDDEQGRGPVDGDGRGARGVPVAEYEIPFLKKLHAMGRS